MTSAPFMRILRWRLKRINVHVSAWQRCAVVFTEYEAGEDQRWPATGQRYERYRRIAERLSSSDEHGAELLNSVQRFVDEEEPP